MIIVSYDSNFHVANATVKYLNPRLYKGKIKDCDYVVTDNPRIAEDYWSNGIPEYYNRHLPKQEPVAPQPEPVKEEQAEEEVEIPEDWRDMNFFSMRSLANKLTDEKVSTKDEAIQVIEAYE